MHILHRYRSPFTRSISRDMVLVPVRVSMNTRRRWLIPGPTSYPLFNILAHLVFKSKIMSGALPLPCNPQPHTRVSILRCTTTDLASRPSTAAPDTVEVRGTARGRSLDQSREPKICSHPGALTPACDGDDVVAVPVVMCAVAGINQRSKLYPLAVSLLYRGRVAQLKTAAMHDSYYEHERQPHHQYEDHDERAHRDDRPRPRSRPCIARTHNTTASAATVDITCFQCMPGIPIMSRKYELDGNCDIPYCQHLRPFYPGLCRASETGSFKYCG